MGEVPLCPNGVLGGGRFLMGEVPLYPNVCGSSCLTGREIGILLPNNQRQHRTLRIQKNVPPYALC